KKVNDEFRIQALVDGKRVNIKESLIRRILRLDDAEGTSCLTNAEIFEGLARMRYEKPFGKLTFYKAFFSPQWKFLIHTILQCLSAKPHHEISSATLWHLPSFVLLPIRNLISQGTGFSSDVTPLFDNMLVQTPEEVAEHNVPLPSPSHDPLPGGKDSLKLKKLMDLYTNLSNKILDLESEVLDIKSTYKEKFEKLKSRVKRLEEENMVLKELKGVHSTVGSDEPVMGKKESSKQGRKIADIDADVEINLEKVQAKAYNLDLDHQEKVLNMLDVNDEEPAGVEEVLGVVTAAKLITKVVTTSEVDVNAVSVQDAPITAAEVTKVIVEVPKPRKRREKEVRQEKEVKVESSKKECESLEKEIAKKQKMEQETEDLKKRLQIVLDDDDDVYADATPLASKIPIIFLLVKKMYPLTHFTLE
nr:hypothetical protein [Tanacetum cinerariifolium]